MPLPCFSILTRGHSQDICSLLLIFIYFGFYLFTFREGVREGGREGETKGEKHQCERHIDCLPLAHPQLGTLPATQACALTGSRTGEHSTH